MSSWRSEGRTFANTTIIIMYLYVVLICYIPPKKTFLTNIISGDDCFKRLEKEFPENSKLLMEKGVYFYDYAGNYDIFSQHEFPPHSAFYSKLHEENITEKDYQRARVVYDTFNCRTLLEYMLLYVKLDTG